MSPSAAPELFKLPAVAAAGDLVEPQSFVPLCTLFLEGSDLFKHIDENGDGIIDLAEFNSACANGAEGMRGMSKN